MALSAVLKQSHHQALTLSQKASQLFRRNSAAGILDHNVTFLSPSESAEQWTEYERMFLSCLRTGDDKGAFLFLDRLIDRFGATNAKIMGLRGLYQEAVAEGESDLKKILQEYNDILVEDSANTPICKRRITLLRTLGMHNDAADALTELLDSSPTDIEAWTELGDLYIARGMYSQAIFCFEEVLLVAPNAWNIHARLGEVLYAVGRTRNANCVDLLQSLQRFCRSIELCDSYIRGYYGLKLVSDHVLSLEHKDAQFSGTVEDPTPPPSTIAAIRRLNEQATLRLLEVTRQGTDSSEIAAAAASIAKEVS